MALDPTYANRLRDLISNPSSFSGTPGYRFAYDQGLQATERGNSRQRNSGNALLALQKFGSGLASQDYGGEVDRLGRLAGQEQQYALGTEANRLTGARDANAFTLGSQQNANASTRNSNDYSLGLGRLGLDSRSNDQQYGLGLMREGNNAQANANTAQRNWWDYDLGVRGNDTTAARDQNNFNLGVGRNNIDWFNAGTSRGRARADQFNTQQRRDPVNTWAGNTYTQRWI